MADAQPLSISDVESTYRGILDLIMQYPNYPVTFEPSNKTVMWNGTASGTSIGLFLLQGAIYLKKYVSGSYTGQIPFEIVFKTTPTTNLANINATDLLTDIGRWLEGCKMVYVDDKTTFESITRTTPVFIASKDEKSTEFAINMQLKYSQKK